MLSLRALACTFFFAAVSASTEPLLCMRFCLTVIEDPICASNGKTWKVFNSLCELKNAECGERVSYEVRDMGECRLEEGSFIVDPLMPTLDIEQPKIALRQTDVYINDPVDKIILPIKVDQCDFYCLDVYDPVCGFDGTSYVTFSNGCQLTRSNCVRKSQIQQVSKNLCKIIDVVAYDGQIVPRAASCSQFCPEYYLPVCGFDGTNYRTFSNSCFMQVANCNAQKKFEPATDIVKCGVFTNVLF